MSDPIKINKCGVSDLGVSDHLLIYCTRKCKKVPVNDHNGIKLRSLINYTKEAFEGKLQQMDWQEVTSCDTVHEVWYNFKCTFLAVIDDIAPLRYVRVKQRTDPWMTGEILHLIHERDRALTKLKKSKDHSWQEKFIYLRNQVQYKKKQAKSDFLANKVDEYKKNNQKNCGKLSKCNTKSGSICLSIDNNTCFGKSKVTEQFNKFFTTIASSLVDKLPPSVAKYGWRHKKEYCRSLGAPANGFSCSEVLEDKVLKILCKLNSSKATGLDQISPRFAKDGAKLIASPLTHILNLSHLSGELPDDLKTARVTPIHKKIVN